METITFYSYKGGVGRTLTLANIATYLSRFRLDVCLMDFDLESPGLHYKFPQFLEPDSIRAGLVDCIYEFAHNGVIAKSLDEYSVKVISSSENRGKIRLIPAGNVLSSDYWRRLASINWHSLFYEEESEGIPFFLELKERIKKEFNPDFLLIDSRTGVTEMSGLCTSLLPDKVVFLIVNNQENIEGARQILRSIQKAERLPSQKPIEVTFALTRIPVPQRDEDKETEKQILKDIEDFLNKPAADLESQLDVREICVLHSDRDLELSESLRFGEGEVPKEAPLLRDYAKLFSRIIPNEVILPKLDTILDEITTSVNIFRNPDKTQRDLEEFVWSYQHPKSLERLIDFYILRNVGREKVLDAFHDLWETFGIDAPELLSKYVSFFMKGSLSTQEGKPNFELEIVEEFLRSNPANKIEVRMRLIEAYREYDKPDSAVKHYLRLIDEAKEKEGIFEEILDIYIGKGLYDDAMKLFESYSESLDIDDNIPVRIKKAKIALKRNEVKIVRELLDDGGVTEKNLLDREPILYYDIMRMLERKDEADGALNAMLNIALKTQDYDRLLKVGEVFYQLGKEDDFRIQIATADPTLGIEQMIRNLERKYRGG